MEALLFKRSNTNTWTMRFYVSYTIFEKRDRNNEALFFGKYNFLFTGIIRE